MAQDYAELAAFMRTHSSDPLELAKIMVAWEWSSLLPGGPNGPTSVESVPTVLTGTCGWRDALLEALFAEIDVPHRRVNFHDVPFQVGHSATELFIDGKWMFFDGSLGIYFELEGGSAPLSMEEARSHWPDVVVKQCFLPGWQGIFVDPDSISPEAYETRTDMFFVPPEAYTSARDWVRAEVESVYFGPKATYVEGGRDIPIPSAGRTWKTYLDDADAQPWAKIVDSYDAAGRRDSRVGHDDELNSYWFVDWDQDDSHAWKEKTTYIDKSFLDLSVTIFDDGSKLIVDNDQDRSIGWTSKSTHYATNGNADYQLVEYDDGQSSVFAWDVNQTFDWSSHKHSFDSAGRLKSTYVTYEDGTTRLIPWTGSSRLEGTGAADSITGSADDELLHGGAGDDVLDGGPGADALEGGLGNDTYIIDHSDFLVEKADEGVDLVISAANFGLGANFENLELQGDAIYGTGNELANTITGTAGSNILSGLAGDDHLRGLAGDDLLSGGGGNDTLEGGIGRDTLWGGPGADTFSWRDFSEVGTMPQADVVEDFSRSAGDLLDLALVDADMTLAGDQDFTFVGTSGFSEPGQVRYVQQATETLVLLNVDADAWSDAVIRMSGKLMPDASWFVL